MKMARIMDFPGFAITNSSYKVQTGFSFERMSYICPWKVQKQQNNHIERTYNLSPKDRLFYVEKKFYEAPPS